MALLDTRRLCFWGFQTTLWRFILIWCVLNCRWFCYADLTAVTHEKYFRLFDAFNPPRLPSLISKLHLFKGSFGMLFILMATSESNVAECSRLKYCIKALRQKSSDKPLCEKYSRQLWMVDQALIYFVHAKDVDVHWLERLNFWAK